MKHIEFDIPRGITDGDYTVQGEGEFVPGGASGDLIVRVTVVKHQTFRRDDDDIYCDKEISMVHAVLGIGKNRSDQAEINSNIEVPGVTITFVKS